MERWPRRHLLTVGVIVAAALIVVAFALTRSTGSGGGPDIQIPMNQHVEIGHRTDSRVTSFVVGTICLTGSGTVTITDVSAIDSQGGARITDFSVFPAKRLGDSHSSEIDRTIAQSDSFNGGKIVEAECDSETDDRMLLAVEVSRPASSGLALTRGLTARYNSGHGSIDVPIDLGMCTAACK